MEQTCQEIQDAIVTKTAALKKIKTELDTLYNSDLQNRETVNQITVYMGIEDHLKAELASLQTQQRRQGCIVSGSSTISADTYTTLAGAAVRKKEGRALEIMSAKSAQ